MHLKYCTSHPLFKLVKMGEKVDISKSFYYGQRCFFTIKEECKISCVQKLFSLFMKKSVFI